MITIIKTKNNLYRKIYKGETYKSKDNDVWECYSKEGIENVFGTIVHWLDCDEPEIKSEDTLTIIDLEITENGQTRRYGDTHRFCNIYIKKSKETFAKETIIKFIEKYFDERINNKNNSAEWWYGTYTLNYSETYNRWEYRGFEPYLD